jgi:hypothetical protein
MNEIFRLLKGVRIPRAPGQANVIGGTDSLAAGLFDVLEGQGLAMVAC